jgi:ankyrin repeat protein
MAVVQLLLEYDADVNVVRGRDDTALEIAYREDNTELVKLLLDNGACINVGEDTSDSPK